MEDIQTVEATEVVQTENAASEAEQVAESAPAETPEKPKVDPVQRRIDRLTKEKYQSRAEADVLRRELELLRQAQQAPQQRQQQTGEPKLDQFNDFESYVSAKAEWIADQKLQKAFAEREQNDRQSKAQESQQKAVEGWHKRLSEVRSTIPDYDDVIESADVTISQEVGQAIMESDMGPKIAYYLALHPEEAERMAGMSQSGVYRAIGKLEAKLEGEQVVKTKSDAPKPVTPVGAKSGGSSKDPDKMTTDEWLRWRNSQIKARSG